MDINSHSASRRTKILFVITKSVWGGAQKYIVDLASGLDKNSFEALVAAGGQGPLKEKIQKLGLAYFEIPYFERDIQLFADVFSFFEILSLLFKIKPDVIHVNSSKAGGVCGLAGFIYKLSGQKILMIFTAHGWAFHEPRPKIQLFLIRFLSRLTCLFYDKIICVSEFDLKSALEKRIAPQKKLIAIHNGINTNYKILEKKEARKRLGILENALVIGNLAEWTRNKGVDILLEAMVEIVSERKERNILIFLIGSGENSEKDGIKKLASDLNLEDKTIMLDFIDNAAQYLRAFDIFVFPSRKEGLAYALMEASLAELPIIASAVGANHEIIEDKKNGLIVPPENPNELKKAILYLIENPAKGLEFGQKARDKVLQEFSLTKMREKTYQLYK